jgi:Universal stress protein family
VYKKILFPFSPDRSLNAGYSWAMQLAARMNAALFFFTSVPDNEKNKAAFVHQLSHTLLEAQGNYLQYASLQISPTKTERHIGEGDFPFSLLKFMKKNRFDIVVIDPDSSNIARTTLDYVVENSDGVIVLPTQPENSPAILRHAENEITEDFYDILHRSDLYKLPDNFFTTLGQDKGLFNYLRGFFKRKGKLPDN